MFTVKPPASKTGLESAINKLLSDMEIFEGDSEEYAKMVEQLDVLYKLKEVDQKVESHRRISADTLAIVAANLLGILIIVGHERAHVVTSKALGFMLKLR